jgi:putative pyoverdin transport system ATP-binding/permease protein
MTCDRKRSQQRKARLSMEYFLYLFKKDWKTMIMAAVTGAVAGSGCSAMIIALIHRQLRQETAPEPYLPVLFGLFIIAYYALSSYSEYLLLSISQQELCRLRLSFSRRVLELPLKRIEEIGGPDLLASLTNDIERIAITLRQLPTLFLNGSMIIGAGLYVAWLSRPLFLVTVVLVSLGVYLYRLPLKKLALLQGYWVLLRDGWDHLFRHFHALTHGTKELLIHRERREQFFDMRLRETCSRLRDDSIKGKTIQNLFFRLGDTLYLLVLGIVLFVLAPWLRIEHQVLTGYIMAGLFVISPIGSLLNFGPNFGEAAIALEKLETLGVRLDGEEPKQSSPEVSISTTTGAHPLLRLEGVTYRYRREADDGEFRLGPLSLEIRQGETAFIAGGNGSGKTTLLKLLCGLYEPEAGKIFWQGEEVTAENRESYRQFFSVVFSDFYLFDTLFGLESVSRDADARKYLQRLQLEKKVSVAGGRLSTTDLSQGQRKRLALLTAYLEDRPVYMFDEWAADQDPVFKGVFYRELIPELKSREKTLLVITHDDAWYDAADRIVKLRDGQIISDTLKAMR